MLRIHAHTSIRKPIKQKKIQEWRMAETEMQDRVIEWNENGRSGENVDMMGYKRNESDSELARQVVGMA